MQIKSISAKAVKDTRGEETISVSVKTTAGSFEASSCFSPVGYCAVGVAALFAKASPAKLANHGIGEARRQADLYGAGEGQSYVAHPWPSRGRLPLA